LEQTIRKDFIDIAKAIGLIMVIYVHTEGSFKFYGGFYIALFFIASGYVFKKKNDIDFTKFIHSKWKRLVVPYVIFSILFILYFKNIDTNSLIGVVYSRFCLFPFGTENNIIFMESGNMVLWFLTAMFTSYLFFYLIIRFHFYRLYLIPIFLIITFFLNKLPILLPWSLDTAFFFSLFLYCGYLFKTTDIVEKSNNYFIIIALLLCVSISIINGGVNLSVRIYGHSIAANLITGITGSYLCLILSKWIEKTKMCKLMSAIGRNSLSIFSVQMVILYKLHFLNTLLFEKFSLPINDFSVSMVGLIKVVIVISIGFFISRLLSFFLPTIFN